MPPVRDLSQEPPFGRLTVLGRSAQRLPVSGRKGRERGWTLPLWECRCDCGRIVLVPTARLTSGNTRSCGCLQRDKASVSGLKATAHLRPRLCRRCGVPFLATANQQYHDRACKDAAAVKLPLTAAQRERKRQYLEQWRADRAAAQMTRTTAELIRRLEHGS